MKPLNLTEQRFGKLVAKNKQRDHKNRVAWECVCDCGNTYKVLTNYLTSGAVCSCGCLTKEHPPRLTHGKSHTRIYSIWKGMLRRCSDTKHIKSLKNYILYGIAVCPEWLLTVDNFENWANNNGYEFNLSLDRIDNLKGYSPENCRWVNATIQSRNRKKLIDTTSKYIGVSFDKSRNKWFATVHVADKKLFHKRFTHEIEAAKARDEFIKNNNLLGYTLNF